MHDDQTEVSDLVAQALEHRDETGTEIDLGQLCQGRPDLQTQVEVALKAATRLPLLQSAGVGGLPMLGDELSGRYRIDERLGAGAMGVVYAATDLELGRRVAIKVLHHGVMERGQALARFEREAEALAAVRQECVVTIYDRGFTRDEAPFLIMELVEGVPLSSLLDFARERASIGVQGQASQAGSAVSGSLDGTEWLKDEFGLLGVPEPSFLRQAVRWAADIAGGLVAIHGAGIVHRDVKPSNIMIRWDGRPVILDFGAVVTEAATDLTRTGAAVGTPAYMAPETLESGDGSLPPADVYGLCATLYHLVTLSAPYEGTPTQILSALSTRDPIPASKLRRGLPRDVAAILDRGMARRPRNRYADAGELRADLQAFLAYRPVRARRVSSLERTARRLYRSRAARGGVAVAVLGAIALGWTAWAGARDAGRSAAFQEAAVHVPANFGIISYANRVVADDDMTRDLRLVFDRLVASRGEPVVAHSLRAAFRLDHGDAAGAADDMAAVARTLGTPFSAELARRYDALDASSTSAADLNLDELPATASPLDRYLAAFQSMRQLDYGTATPLLEDPELDGIRHAQELELLMTMSGVERLEGDERFAAAGRVYEEAIRIEERFGYRTSMTAHMAGYGLSTQDRFAEALELCREAVDLAPTSHSSSLNAARNALRSGEMDEADHWVDYTIHLVPQYPKAYVAGTLRRLADSDYDGARAWLAGIPFSNSGRDQRELFSWLIRIGTDEALGALMAEEGGRAAELATEVLGHAKKFGKSLAGDNLTYASLCEAIVAGKPAKVFELVCERQIEDPLWPAHLRTLIELIPPDLSDDARLDLQEVLSAIAKALGRRQGHLSAASPPAR